MPSLDAQDSAALVGLLMMLVIASMGLVRTRRAYKRQREREKAAREQREAAERAKHHPPGPWDA